MAGNYKPNYTKREEWTNSGTQAVMTFYPTLEEMTDFSAYIQKCEESGAVKASGICKIVPPKEWSPRPNLDPQYNDILDYKINSPVKESIAKTSRGAFVKQNRIYRREMTVKAFRDLALSHKFANPKPESSLQELERHYWRNLTFGEPLYGADTPGSCYEDSVEKFNVSKLGTILDLLKETGIDIPGVTSTYLYFGMYKATFAWHIEDCDLYSINFLHYGEPKFWYAVPPSECEKMERLFEGKFPNEARRCKAYLRHKTFIVSISELKSARIPYGTMVQYPGEFIITFPRGFHMGFNVGYNLAESTNFALDRWIDFGKSATICKCVNGSVEVDMRPFMKKYRPDEFEDWYNFWYGERTVILRSDRSDTPTELPVVDLPSIDQTVKDSFVEQLVEARNDYNYLWHHQHDFKEECQYNKTQAKYYPHCAVCQYFVPQNDKEAKLDSQSKSMRYVGDQLYDKLDSDKTVLNIQESRLIQCRRCLVVAHVDCLNLGTAEFLDTSNESDTSSVEHQSPAKKRRMNWLCKRCEFAREELICASIQCLFCPVRGGVLIPHEPEKTHGKFVHLVCALMSRRTKILRSENSIYARSLAKDWIQDLSRSIPPWRELDLNKDYLVSDYDFFLNKSTTEFTKCALCKTELDDQFVHCLHCYDMDEKPIYFHTSCAYFARLTLEYRNFPTLIVATCPCHTQQPSDDKLKIGEKVLFYSKDRIDTVRVLDTKTDYYCHVEFFDATFSQDVTLDDIVDCECKRIDCKGKHVTGFIVSVRWENKVFQGYMRQMRSDISYVVESTQTKETFVCSRKPLYRHDQKIPENIAKVIQNWHSKS